MKRNNNVILKMVCASLDSECKAQLELETTIEKLALEIVETFRHENLQVDLLCDAIWHQLNSGFAETADQAKEQVVEELGFCNEPIPEICIAREVCVRLSDGMYQTNAKVYPFRAEYVSTPEEEKMFAELLDNGDGENGEKHWKPMMV